MSIPDPVR